MSYYPILKLRSSEIQSINEVEKQFNPIIEIDNEIKPKNIEYLKEIKNRAYYLDLKNNNELLDTLKNTDFFPVLGIDKDYYHNFTCLDIAKKTKKAIIRVKKEDFNKISEINSLSKAMDKTIDAKILLDLETLNDNQIDINYSAIDYIIPKLINKNIIIAGNSVPGTVSDMKINEYKEIDRLEWFLYRQLKQKHNNILFGDYSVRHHESIGGDMPFMIKVFVKLVYTTEDGFIIFKGERANEKGKTGAKSIIPICKKILELEDYKGKEYSFGDKEIHIIATQDGVEKTGASKEWIKIGHTHHITLLSDLLSS